MALKDIIQTKVIAMGKDETIKQAAQLMYNEHVGAVVVVDKKNGVLGTPLGIVTDRDITMCLGKNGKLDTNRPINEIMSPNVIVCSTEDGVYETINKMKANGIRRIPVINKQDSVVGMLSSDDLIQLLGTELSELSQILTNETNREKNIHPQIKSEDQIEARSSRL